MARNKQSIKIISAFLSVIFLFQQVVWAAGDTHVPAARNVMSLTSDAPLDPPIQITLPSELAETETSSIGANGETIINIQDCHSSLTAQYSIARILGELVQNYDVRLVAVEGGSGYIDTSLLRSHPDADVRERTASFLMKEGRMSAGEFFAVTSPEEVALYGAEDNELYRKNVECFRNIHECNRENIVFINSILSKLRKVEEKVYSPSLARFIYRSRLHRQSRISFDVYWPALVAIASENGVELSGFEHINRFRASVSMEKDIDFKKATEERNRLMGELAGAVPGEEIEEMVSQAASFEKGKIDQYDFHKWLIAFASNKGFDTSGYPELAKYGEYIKGYRQLDVIGLSEELAGAEEKILGELLSNEKEKRLYELVRGLEAIRGLFEIQLLGDEVEIAKKAISGSFGEGLSAFLGREFAEPLSNALEKARTDAAKAISFYEIAERRNTVMIANTIKSMRDEGKHVAALISGGYHSAGLTDLMKEKGLSYLVLMPKYNKDGERPYVAVLTKKAGPYREAARGSGYLALESYFDTGDITNLEEMIAFALGQSRISGKDPQKEISNWVASYREAYEAIPRARKELMAEPPVTPGRFEEFLVSSVVDGASDEACTVTIGGNVYRVTRDKADHIGEDGTLGHSSGHPMSYNSAIAWQRGLTAFAFLFALSTIGMMVSAGTYLSLKDMTMYAGGALLLTIYLAASQERFYRLAKAVDEAFAREGIDKEARRSLAIADHVSRHRVNRH
ncbi:MAG: hypothetical protein PHT95_04950, partial [Candidatus Omnitrophica bacterium]|nr:hypothetical protein [Candidatus Omnitrophota bacterium]